MFMNTSLPNQAYKTWQYEARIEPHDIYRHGMMAFFTVFTRAISVNHILLEDAELSITWAGIKKTFSFTYCTVIQNLS